MGVPRAVALVLATGLARHPAGLSALAFSKIGWCGVGRSAEIRTRDPQSPSPKHRRVATHRRFPTIDLWPERWCSYSSAGLRPPEDEEVNDAQHHCHVLPP